MTEKENIEVATDATHPPIAAKAAAAKGKDHEVVVPPNVLEEMPRALVNRITKSAVKDEEGSF